eukprot:1070768-Amphidinium_carterae.1
MCKSVLALLRWDWVGSLRWTRFGFGECSAVLLPTVYCLQAGRHLKKLYSKDDPRSTLPLLGERGVKTGAAWESPFLKYRAKHDSFMERKNSGTDEDGRAAAEDSSLRTFVSTNVHNLDS